MSAHNFSEAAMMALMSEGDASDNWLIDVAELGWTEDKAQGHMDTVDGHGDSKM